MLATKKIIFVTPPYHCGVVEVAGSWPCLGFLTLGAQAELAGWTVEVYDAMTLRHDLDKIGEHLKNTHFDILATTAITPTFPAASSVCRLAKTIRPQCTTLIGGVHPTFCYREIFEDPENAIDYVIAGEGELPLNAFLEGFHDLDRRHQTPNLVFMEEGQVHRNPSLPLVKDLDTLPTAWHLLDWSKYKYYVIPGSTLGAISTSRGCNHGCTFCSQQRFWQRSWRSRSPESVLEDMRHLNATYGVNVFLFTDEYPTPDRDRWERLLDLIIEEDMGIYILMETRVEDIIRDRDILEKYRQAGIVHVYVGAEATDQATLDRMNKEITVSESRLAIQLLADYAIMSETSFILGFPEETKESIEGTFQIAKEFNPDFAHFLAITPWPYSQLYAEVKEYIEDFDYANYNLIEPVIKPIAMSRDEVDLAIIDCYRRFYMPKMLEFHKVKDPFRKDYLLRSMKLIMKSSFLIKKFARLGLNPAVVMKDVMRTKTKVEECPAPAANRRQK